MAKPDSPRAWQRVRRLFRWCRIVVLLGLLALVAAAIYLNQVGLPSFLKDPLLQELRDQGLDLRFNRLRLRWYRGIVAEEVNFGRAHFVSGPELRLREVELRLNHRALRHLKLRVDSLSLVGGRFEWRFAASNRPALPLAVEDLSAALHFPGPDQWRLENLEGRFLGARFQVSGAVTNASRLPELLGAQTRPATGTPGKTPDMLLRGFANALTNFHFAATPTLNLHFEGDGANPHSFFGTLQLTAPDAETPWAKVRELSASARLRTAAATNADQRLEIKFTAARAQAEWGLLRQVEGVALLMPDALTNALNEVSFTIKAVHGSTKWGEARQLSLRTQRSGASNLNDLEHQPITLEASASELDSPWGRGRGFVFKGEVPPRLIAGGAAPAHGRIIMQDCRTRWGDFLRAELTATVEPDLRPDLLNTRLTLDATGVETLWGKANDIRLVADTLLCLTNPQPQSATGRCDLGRIQIGSFSAARGDLVIRLRPRTTPRPAATGFAALDELAPWEIELEARVQEAAVDGVQLEQAGLRTRMELPGVEITSLQATGYGGELGGSAQLDTVTRRLAITARSTVDPRRLAPLLPEAMRPWLARCKWQTVPRLEADIRVTLPGWTNPTTNWLPRLLPGLVAEVRLNAGPGSYAGLSFDHLAATLGQSNTTSEVKSLRLDRPEGWLTLTGWVNHATERFGLDLSSRLSPDAIRPLLSPEARQGFALLQTTLPPEVHAHAEGHLRNVEALAVTGRAALTNLQFRGEHIGEVRAGVYYHAQRLLISNVVVRRPNEEAWADAILVDIPGDHVYLTNAHGRVDPGALTRAIGPKTATAFAPFRFPTPPRARANGAIPLSGVAGADIWFEAEDSPFQWMWFRLGDIKARAHWRNDTLTVTNVQSTFYEGRLAGWGWFDFAAPKGTDFRFHLNTTNMQIRSLLADVSTSSNKVEGWVTGELTITNGNSDDFKHWQGYGWAFLQDGLIWNMPVFGIFSPVLNGISPGLGNSRAHECSATYIITNSVILSEDLEIRGRALRMQYVGTVDFEQRVNARVEAEVLRDKWLVGPVLKVVLKPFTKMFEYKVTGTLNDPHSQPLYIPKLLLAPLQPWKTLKSVLGPGGENTPAPVEPEKP
jgi:hypothetical protein